MDRLTKEQMEWMNGYVPANIHDIYADGGIHIKPSHEGRFTAYKKRTGKTTEEALHSPDPHVRQMANFARNAAKWKHQDGGAAGGEDEMIQQIAQALQKGAKPEQILEELVKMGVPQEEATQTIQAIMKQMQGKMQEGGPAPEEMMAPEGQPQGGQEDSQQIIEAVKQMLQQGATPEQVIAQLLQEQMDPQMIVQIFVQLGMPEQEVMQEVQAVMQQGQPQEQENPEEQMQEQGVEEPEGQPMAYGGTPHFDFGGYNEYRAPGILNHSKFNSTMLGINSLADPRMSGIPYLSMMNNPFSAALGIGAGVAGLAAGEYAAYGALGHKKNDPQYGQFFNNANNNASKIPSSIKLSTPSSTGEMWDKYNAGQRNDLWSKHNPKQDPFKVSNYGSWKPGMQEGGEYEIGEDMYTTTPSVNPVTIPTKSYPLNYNIDLPTNRVGTPIGSDGVLFTNAKKVSRKGLNGETLSHNQLSENQKIWDAQKQAYGPDQRSYNIWKNNQENVENGYYNTEDYQDYLTEIKSHPEVGQEGLNDGFSAAGKACRTEKSSSTKNIKAYGGELPHAQFGKITSEQRKILADIQSGKSKGYSAKNDRASMITGNARKQDVIPSAGSSFIENRKGSLSKQIKEDVYKMNHPNVVVFAESPKTAPTYQFGDARIENIPELKRLQEQVHTMNDEFFNIYKKDPEFIKLNNALTQAESKLSESTNPNSKEVKDYQRSSNNFSNYMNSDKFKKARESIQREIESLENKFNDPKINPRVMDSTFYKEGQNVKDFYKRTNPNVNVDIVPMYNQPGLMEDKLKNLSIYDKAAVFGHSGNKLAGISNDDIADYLSKSKVKNCYFGSCYFEDHIKDSNLKNLKGKTLNYRPSASDDNDNAWYGFNPQAKTFDEGMWSRNYVNGITVTPIKQGKTHIKKRFEHGGNLPHAQVGIPPGFDFNDPYGLQQERFGQTANYADAQQYGANFNARPVAYPLQPMSKPAVGVGIKPNLNIPSYQSKGNPNAVNANKKVINTYNMSGPGIATNMLNSLGMIDNGLGFFDQRQKRKAIDRRNQELGNTMNGELVYNSPNANGEYTVNSGKLKANMYTPIQDLGTTQYAKYGGSIQYQQGGEYHVTHDELLQLMRNGAEVEFL